MKTNYYQVADMTKEEKIAMYMKCTKRELIEMLLENQELLMQSINSKEKRYDTSQPIIPGRNVVIGRTDFTKKPLCKNKKPYDLSRGGIKRK